MKIEIDKDGTIRYLHDDTLDLSELGKRKVRRASHVEFNNNTGKWYVQSAKPCGLMGHIKYLFGIPAGKMLREDFTTREAALAWEKEYYSPDGEGWEELRG
jgi:hypothetical protein